MYILFAETLHEKDMLTSDTPFLEGENLLYFMHRYVSAGIHVQKAGSISIAQNFVYDHFQQPRWDAHSVFLNPICTVLKDGNFIYGVKVSQKLNSAILPFRPDVVPMSGQRLHSPFDARTQELTQPQKRCHHSPATLRVEITFFNILFNDFHVA